MITFRYDVRLISSVFFINLYYDAQIYEIYNSESLNIFEGRINIENCSRPTVTIKPLLDVDINTGIEISAHSFGLRKYFHVPRNVAIIP